MGVISLFVSHPQVMGMTKTVVFVSLVIGLSAITGLIYEANF